MITCQAKKQNKKMTLSTSDRSVIFQKISLSITLFSLLVRVSRCSSDDAT